MGNLGKATSFIDTEGDGDVMPKLVDMLTKVKVSFVGWVYEVKISRSQTLRGNYVGQDLFKIL